MSETGATSYDFGVSPGKGANREDIRKGRKNPAARNVVRSILADKLQKKKRPRKKV